MSTAQSLGLLPVAEAIPAYQRAARYVQTTYQLSYQVEACLYLVLAVLGFLALKGQLSPTIAVSCSVAAHIVVYTLITLVSKVVEQCRGKKCRDYQEEIERLHPHLEAPSSMSNSEALREVDNLVHRVNFIFVLCIATIAILSLNNVLSPHQMKVAAGTALIATGLINIPICYRHYRISRHKGIEFIISHYRMGDPVVAEALSKEASYHKMLADSSSRTRLIAEAVATYA